MNVLVIEDDKQYVDILIELTEDMLKKKFDVQSEPSLKSGIEKLRGGSFDVVVLDLGLPDSGGLETLKRFREACPKEPVVVLTGIDDEETAMEAVRSGAQEYFVKGEIGSVMFRRILRSAVERKVLEDKMREHSDKLESLNQTMTERELKMIELKKENEEFRKKLGETG